MIDDTWALQFEWPQAARGVKKSNYNLINIKADLMENKTARITVLIDPAKKQAFEKLCYAQDMTPSQVMRRLIREFMEQYGSVAKRAASRKR